VTQYSYASVSTRAPAAVSASYAKLALHLRLGRSLGRAALATCRKLCGEERMLECALCGAWVLVCLLWLTLVHVRIAAVEVGALGRDGRGEDVRDGFEAMFVAYAVVFEGDARFSSSMSVHLRALPKQQDSSPSNFANIPKLVIFLLRSSRRPVPRFLARLRHVARRAILFVDLQFVQFFLTDIDVFLQAIVSVRKVQWSIVVSRGNRENRGCVGRLFTVA